MSSPPLSPTRPSATAARPAHGRPFVTGALFTLSLTAAIVLVAPVCLWAIHPQTWTHTTEADFADGEVDGTVVTNLGDIRLATRSRVLTDGLDPSTLIFDALPLPDGSTLLAAGPEGRLLLFDGQTSTELLALSGEQVFCMTALDGRPLLAISGPTPRLAYWDGAALRTLVDLPTAFVSNDADAPDTEDTEDAAADTSDDEDDAGAQTPPAADMDSENGSDRLRYIWDMVVDGPRLYLATGPGGRVLRVDGVHTDTPTVISLVETGQANVLCLTQRDGGPLFAGTDTEGLVVRIDHPADAVDGPEGSHDIASFVAYDAEEPEIAALLAASDGNLYIGTADAEQARLGRLDGPVEEAAGRPTNAERDDATEDAATAASDADAAGDSTDGDDQGDGTAKTDVKPDEEAGDVPTPAAPPTDEQRDALRDVIRARLLKARQSGSLKAGRPSAKPRRAQSGSDRTGRRMRAAAPDDAGEGNAIYRLDPDGFVSQVMRESVMILDLVEVQAPKSATSSISSGEPGAPLSLLVATGNEGQIYRVTPETGEVAMLTDLDAEQVTVILHADSQGLMAATANPASLLALNGQLADTGTFTSRPLDAGQIALWGMLHLTADPHADAVGRRDGDGIAVRTRSGNLAEADDRFWSPWSEPIALSTPSADPLAPRAGEITSPPARFLQYQIILTTASASGPPIETGATATGAGRGPSVGAVAITRVVPNLPPRIESLTATYNEEEDEDAGGPAAQSVLALEWEAADPNEDALMYTLEYRQAHAASWLPLAEDVKDANYEWDTRRAPDGRYLIRLTASDNPDNPGPMAKKAARTSEPVVVDNTPPQLNAGPAVNRTEDSLSLTATFHDALLPIREVRYALDSTDEFKPLLADDLIYDSTRESVTVTISDLSPGPHVVVLRAIDMQGNALLHAIEIPAR